MVIAGGPFRRLRFTPSFPIKAALPFADSSGGRNGRASFNEGALIVSFDPLSVSGVNRSAE